ncbi:phosphate ABC transporter substrate-binding protein PstS [Novosphingobium sp. 9]|uniref:phosphate ABC transporter substrate-binding protein PstS n=1 Tax=Novosphingobium sp. 9 TaxID=2025349 RepID=UPI0021B33272|nr:phosphate ABC transporter substrate-binding protein PstS [Novosphingobium sp. 9]
MNRRMILALGAVAMVSGLSGCGGKSGAANALNGAGATFPAPVYAKWAETYRSAKSVAVNYQAIGSGGGIKQIEAKTVDFGASDKPLKPEELEKNGLYQFPTVIGGVVPVINLPGIKPGQVRLTGQALADIFQGKVKTWNDPEIASLNAGVALPKLPITVVHRSDGSGTSFMFTSYLASQSAGWKSAVGASDTVNWPTGLGGKGNDGVSAFVQQTVGAIGYVEYAYAKQNGATYALLRNQAGNYPAPTADAFAAAAAGADWSKAPGNYIMLIDQPGQDTWPISGATFILMHKQPKDAARAKAVLAFFDWAYTSGDDTAKKLDYVPLPDSVKAMVRQQWQTSIVANGKPVYTRRPSKP